MVKHIVMFKLLPFESAEAKERKLVELKEIMLSFKERIPGVLSLSVGLNANPKESWDLVLECEFESMKTLESYVNHPIHVAFGRDIMGPVKGERACVDYIY